MASLLNLDLIFYRSALYVHSSFSSRSRSLFRFAEGVRRQLDDVGVVAAQHTQPGTDNRQRQRQVGFLHGDKIGCTVSELISESSAIASALLPCCLLKI